MQKGGRESSKSSKSKAALSCLARGGRGAPWDACARADSSERLSDARPGVFPGPGGRGGAANGGGAKSRRLAPSLFFGKGSGFCALLLFAPLIVSSSVRTQHTLTSCSSCHRRRAHRRRSRSSWLRPVGCVEGRVRRREARACFVRKGAKREWGLERAFFFLTANHKTQRT